MARLDSCIDSGQIRVHSNTLNVVSDTLPFSINSGQFGDIHVVVRLMILFSPNQDRALRKVSRPVR